MDQRDYAGGIYFFSQLIQTANDINLEIHLILIQYTISNTTPLPPNNQTATEEIQNEIWYEVWTI